MEIRGATLDINFILLDIKLCFTAYNAKIFKCLNITGRIEDPTIARYLLMTVILLPVRTSTENEQILLFRQFDPAMRSRVRSFFYPTCHGQIIFANFNLKNVTPNQ